MQPVVELALLVVGGVQLVPGVGAATRRAQAGDAQLGAVGVGQRLEVVELVDVVAGHDDADLERAEVGVARGGPWRARGGGERAVAADGVVDVGVGAVDRDLDVEVVHRRQPAGRGGVDVGAVGRELHADPVGVGVLDDLEEVGADHRLAAADVDVEDLQALRARRSTAKHSSVRQLARVAASRRAEAVDAREVAGVGQLPREADGGVEARP